MLWLGLDVRDRLLGDDARRISRTRSMDASVALDVDVGVASSAHPASPSCDAGDSAKPGVSPTVSNTAGRRVCAPSTPSCVGVDMVCAASRRHTRVQRAAVAPAVAPVHADRPATLPCHVPVPINAAAIEPCDAGALLQGRVRCSAARESGVARVAPQRTAASQLRVNSGVYSRPRR